LLDQHGKVLKIKSYMLVRAIQSIHVIILGHKFYSVSESSANIIIFESEKWVTPEQGHVPPPKNRFSHQKSTSALSMGRLGRSREFAFVRVHPGGGFCAHSLDTVTMEPIPRQRIIACKPETQETLSSDFISNVKV
jgi:hypothetical protein